MWWWLSLASKLEAWKAPSHGPQTYGTDARLDKDPKRAVDAAWFGDRREERRDLDMQPLSFPVHKRRPAPFTSRSRKKYFIHVCCLMQTHSSARSMSCSLGMSRCSSFSRWTA